MEPHEALRILRSPTVPYGAHGKEAYEGLRSPWRPMKSYGALRNPAESYGALRSTMEPYGAQGGAQDGAHRTVPKNFLDDFQCV